MLDKLLNKIDIYIRKRYINWKAEIFTSEKKYSEAIGFYHELLDLEKSTHEKVRILNNLSLNYYRNKEYSRSHYYAKKAKNLGIKDMEIERIITRILNVTKRNLENKL